MTLSMLSNFIAGNCCGSCVCFVLGPSINKYQALPMRKILSCSLGTERHCSWTSGAGFKRREYLYVVNRRESGNNFRNSRGADQDSSQGDTWLETGACRDNDGRQREQTQLRQRSGRACRMGLWVPKSAWKSQEGTS